MLLFSLVLMVVNYLHFVVEAHRYLKKGGHLIIAETISRIPDNTLLVQMVKHLGFMKYVRK